MNTKDNHLENLTLNNIAEVATDAAKMNIAMVKGDRLVMVFVAAIAVSRDIFLLTL